MDLLLQLVFRAGVVAAGVADQFVFFQHFQAFLDDQNCAYCSSVFLFYPGFTRLSFRQFKKLLYEFIPRFERFFAAKMTFRSNVTTAKRSPRLCVECGCRISLHLGSFKWLLDVLWRVENEFTFRTVYKVTKPSWLRIGHSFRKYKTLKWVFCNKYYIYWTLKFDIKTVRMCSNVPI